MHGFLCEGHKDSAKGQAHIAHHHRRKVIKHNQHQHYVIEQFKRLIESIKQGNKLDDDHMNAASQLLQGQFQNLRGLSSPAGGQKFSFERFDWIMGHTRFLQSI